MNQCPKCHEYVMEMAATCRHCGGPIDEKTFFLSESSLVEEVKAAKEEAEKLILKQRRRRQIAQWLLTVGVIVSGVGVGFLLRDALPPWVAVGGLAITGVGLAFLVLSRRKS